jgi:hypothetical protein
MSQSPEITHDDDRSRQFQVQAHSAALTSCPVNGPDLRFHQMILLSLELSIGILV